VIFFQFNNYESGRDAVKGWTASLVLTPLPSTHNKLPYHYGNVYISVPFLKEFILVERFFTICRKHLILRKYISVDMVEV
jgi:hypothetical protein